jgi:urea ABC transporter ATP-binding protein UrtE
MLEISGLQAGYGDGIVLHGLSLQVKPGECLGIMGRNGVGKTSLLKAIMGLLPAKAGRISWQGQTISKQETFSIARLGIGYVPQGREIFADLTVEENLMLGARGRPIDGAFTHFPSLLAKRHAAGGSLSGGQQQQLAIARVLVATPGLILLDEPSDGVQPSIVEDIAGVLLALRQETRITMLLVEQDITSVLRLCDRVVIMESGNIIAEHASAALRANPRLIERELAL